MLRGNTKIRGVGEGPLGGALDTGFFNNYLTGNNANLPPYGIPGAASDIVF